MEKFNVVEPKINGMERLDYMADLIERNERGEIELSRVKASNNTLKQMNNYERYKLDAAKYELKRIQFESERNKQ